VEKPDHRYFEPRWDVSQHPVEKQLKDEIADLFRAIWTRKGLILLSVAVCLLLSVVYLRLATPLYSATTEILIDPRKRQLIGTEVTPAGLGTSALGADTALVESQVAIMQSESVVGGLIDRLDLVTDPEFSGGNGNSLVEIAASVVRGIIYGDASLYERSKYDKAKRKLEKRVSVERIGNTYVVRIESLSQNPSKAALIANTLAEIYIDESRLYSENSTRAAASDIDGRLDALRVDMQVAAESVEQYRDQNGLIGAQNLLVVEQQLYELNKKLSDAQAELSRSEALLNEANRAIADPLTADGSALESNLFLQLVGRLADVRAQEATLQTTLLDGHPRLTALREQRQSLESAVKSELERVFSRYETAVKVARQNEISLKEQISLLEADTAQSNSNSVRLRELQLEADLSQKIYESFRARSKQVNEEVGLRSDNTRVVSAAYPPSRPSHPKGPLLLTVAIAVGLISGVFIAWVLHVFNGTKAPAKQKKKRSIKNFLRGTANESHSLDKKENLGHRSRRIHR
jgi:polysaccharide biosynthesis transport protein